MQLQTAGLPVLMRRVFPPLRELTGISASHLDGGETKVQERLVRGTSCCMQVFRLVGRSLSTGLFMIKRV